MKKNMRKIELVGKSRVVTLKYGHAFNVKPGFIVVTTHRNRYVVSFINDCSARFYQGTAGGGIVRVDIDTRAFSRRFNIAENFVTEVLIPQMRERIWEWGSREAILDKRHALVEYAVKKYSVDELADREEYLILDSVGDRIEYSLFTRIMYGVYEHRTVYDVIDGTYYDDFCEGFVVLTKNRLEKLRKAEARLYAEAEAEENKELTIDINYGELFEESSEGFRYKNPESFDDEEIKNPPMWRKPVERLPPHWWRETRDDDTEE